MKFPTWQNLSTGERLLIWRRNAGLKWHEAAAYLGVSSSAYFRAENDQVPNQIKKKNPRRWQPECAKITVPKGIHIKLSQSQACIILRRRAGLGQLELAQEVGVSRAMLSYMENDQITSTRLIDFWKAKKS